MELLRFDVVGVDESVLGCGLVLHLRGVLDSGCVVMLVTVFCHFPVSLGEKVLCFDRRNIAYVPGNMRVQILVLDIV